MGGVKRVPIRAVGSCVPAVGKRKEKQNNDKEKKALIPRRCQSLFNHLYPYRNRPLGNGRIQQIFFI